jgi:3-oxoacyl-ACP reductase-like protein
MKSKLVTLGITALAIIALSLEASSQAVAQGNANKPAPAKKAKPAATKKNTNAPPPPAPATAAAPATKPAPKKVIHRKKPNAMTGIPSGVANCVKHLSEMAAKDPLIAYEGHPSEIVNNGLLWNDPKSKCSVGSDENMRQKVFDLATAWRMNDAAKVRSILQELEGMSPK